jgi:hypothetical protein
MVFTIPSQSRIYTSRLLVLLGISAILRAWIAGIFELGNDEVYYWTYAVYPDLSHFDHPPMVGWLIRIFTFNLQLQQEFFVRLASVIGGTFNTYLLFSIGRKLKDEMTGWYTALLHVASIYGFVITGIFILPDTAQTVFWLMTLLLMLDVLPDKQPSDMIQRKMIRIGILLGLGLLSKYTTAYLWFGMLLYIVFFNRNWLRKYSFYLANLVMLAFFSIVLVWNIRNRFISFTYQGERGLVSQMVFNFDTFFTEILGELLYTNPVIMIILVLGVIKIMKTLAFKINQHITILLITGIPLIITFLLLSLFRGTLPHWTGPGYMTLLPVAALYIRSRQGEQPSLLPKSLFLALLVQVMVISVAMFQIKTGLIPLEKFKTPKGNSRDFSLDLYGWSQLSEKFNLLAETYERTGEIQKNSVIVSWRWFPSANLEYYAALPSGRKVLASGSLAEIHKYAWINRLHGGFKLNSDAWYITSSLDFRDPALLSPLHYERIFPADTIPIERGGKTAYYFYVYRLKNLQSKPADPLRR